jgi:murein DD-endopeptidase MepM/ murein hydrolase activator NlpD
MKALLTGCRGRQSVVFILTCALVAACGNRPQAEAMPCFPHASAVAVTPKLEQAEPRTVVDIAAERVMRHLQAADADGLFTLFGPSMRQTFPIERVRDLVADMLNEQGALVSLDRLPGQTLSDRGRYKIKAQKADGLLSLIVDRNGGIRGLHISPLTEPEPPVARSELALGLPFKGQWAVLWGGDTYDVNRHVFDRSQRRAADLLRVGPDGLTHRGDGASNSDYYAYGEEVLAVADGTVVTAIDGVPDNEPGAENPYVMPGNTVVVEHAASVFSAYGHMQPGTIRVKVGGSVRRGATLGLCGNSGSSSEPHLHFQLQDGLRIEDSWGITPVFDNVSVTRGGKTMSLNGYAFLRGDLVAPYSLKLIYRPSEF